MSPLGFFTVIVTTPALTPVTKPFLSTVATEVLLLVQVTNSVADSGVNFLFNCNFGSSNIFIFAVLGIISIPVIDVSTTITHVASFPCSVRTFIFADPFDIPVTFTVLPFNFSTCAISGASLIHDNSV